MGRDDPRIIAEDYEAKTVTISRRDFDQLIDRDEWLDCLEAAGVDNWSGYDVAVDISRENGREDDDD